MTDAGSLWPATTGVALALVLIAGLRVHALLALLIAALWIALVGGATVPAALTSIRNGFGGTIGGVGLVLALGAIHGGLLVHSGAAQTIAGRLVDRVGPAGAPWAVAALAALIGIPLFFEVGVVVLMPVILAVANRIDQPGAPSSLLAIGLPALAALSVMHGLVPPHPGPLAAIQALNADFGLTMAFGVLIAVPTAVIGGPLLARLVVPGVRVRSGAAAIQHEPGGRDASVALALGMMLLPVALVIGGTRAPRLSGGGLPGAAALLGDPAGALLATVLIGAAVLALSRRGQGALGQITPASLRGVAEVIVIVGAGGALKQVLIDGGTAGVVAQLAERAAISPLLLGWLVAVAVRLATGSATVATLTAAGLLAGAAAGLDDSHRALLVLAIGAGSLFLSHVNDAGFWLVKELFGMSVGDTLRTWSTMETVISVTGLALVMAIAALLK